MPDYERRIAEFARRMGRHRVGAWWLLTPENLRYLCGFTGEDSALLLTSSRSVLITDSRYTEQAEEQARADEVHERHTTIPRTVAGLCKGLGVGRLAVTAANTPHAACLAFCKAAPQAELVAAKKGVAEQMRRRKEPAEVEAIRRSLKVAEEAFRSVAGQVEPGRSEKWVAARLEYEMRLKGAEKASFDIICAADARASVPHAVTGEGRLTPRSTLLVDWGARLDGYCCDLTRLLCIDRIPKVVDDLAEIVLEAQAAILQKLKPGSTCGEADAAGRAVIAGAGYGSCFGHGSGHGVGLAVHEEPRLGPGSETPLLPGMVVTVEPGIYLRGETGVRIEEMVLITGDGHQVLSSLPREPQELRAAAGRPAAEAD